MGECLGTVHLVISTLAKHHIGNSGLGLGKAVG